MYIAELKGLNPLLIGAHCERDVPGTLPTQGGLNPLLIGAHCEPWCREAPDGIFRLNPLLIGAHCALQAAVESLGAE